MKNVNAFFRDLKVVLSKNKKTKKEMQDTTPPNLRARSIDTYNSDPTQPHIHALPAYISKPTFPIPLISKEDLWTPMKLASTAKTTLHLTSTVKLIPTALRTKPNYPSVPTHGIPKFYFNKLFQKHTFPTHFVPTQFTFPPAKRSSHILIKSFPNFGPTKFGAVKFNQVYNLRAEVDSLTTIYSTLSTSSVIPKAFNDTSALAAKPFSDRSLHASTTTFAPITTPTTSSEATTITSAPKTSLTPPSTSFHHYPTSTKTSATPPLSPFTIPNPKSPAFESKIATHGSRSYRTTTDKYLGLWQKEMTNFASPHTWKIKLASDVTTTTQRTTPRPGWNLIPIKPIAYNPHWTPNLPPFKPAYNRRNRTRYYGQNRQKDSRKKRKRLKYLKRIKQNYPMLLFTTIVNNSSIPNFYGHLHDEPTENDSDIHTTFKTTIINGSPVYLPVDPNEGSTIGLLPTASTKSPNLRYYEMMKELDEGYMMIFLIELCRIISTKDQKHVHDVIKHTGPIINESHANGRLHWMGSPLLEITLKLANFISEAPIDLTRAYAGMMYHMLRARKQTLSPEVNSIIDYAEFLYTDEEGENLFNSLREFEAYPEISKSGYLLCSTLIENFLSPYRRLHQSERRQRLLDSINKELRDKFPQISLKTAEGTNSRYRIGEETRHWPKFRAFLESDESGLSTSDSESEIKRKLRLKRRLRIHNIRKQANNEITHKSRRQMDINGNKYLELRSMKPITKAQRRYKVVTSKYHMKRSRKRTTESYPFSLQRRPTIDAFVTIPDLYLNTPFPYFHEQKDYLNPEDVKVYHRTGGKKRRQRRPKQTIDFERLQNYYYPFEEYFRQSEPVRSVSRVTNAYLKRIVEVSSYSDEEDSLQRNLNGALFYNGTSATETTYTG
ncbi:uncharacterized protein LOC118281218 isoform X2 [Spodoptera frugiperda]|uniref:Uncharacterized protein LOC118281218 isoform X2 n=1 Tax=Spodoptera frugiperda TaxID=7108 RepID=A0A9R0E116_SPOFR|nr:uncharacterized protein LOC118281218 isoform X2 [Spodoptera frugiperda]